MGNSGDNHDHLKQAVIMGHLDADDVSIHATAEMKAAELRSAEKTARDSDKDEFVLQLQAVNDYLDRIDQVITQMEADIAELERRRIEAQQAADEAFERMHEAEDLLELMEDGVSDNERQRAKQLLGNKSDNASDEQLILLLHAYTQEQQSVGHQESQEAEELAQRIREDKQNLDHLKQERDAYREAKSPEAQQAAHSRTEEIISTLDDPTLRQQLQEKVDFDVPDFAIWGHLKAAIFGLKINLKAFTRLLLQRLALLAPEHLGRSSWYPMRCAPSTFE